MFEPALRAVSVRASSGAGCPDGLDYFSRRTPLKGFGSAFWSMNFPVSVSRFT
jgi:hypothetical protein